MKLALLGGVALLAAPLGASAQDVTLRLAHWLPAQHAVPQTGMQEWMDSITEESGGSITFEVFPAQQLGAAPDHYDMTRDGVADIGYVNPGYNAGRFPIYELTGVPFLATDGPNAAKAIHEWYAGEYAEAEMGDVRFCRTSPGASTARPRSGSPRTCAASTCGPRMPPWRASSAPWAAPRCRSPPPRRARRWRAAPPTR